MTHILVALFFTAGLLGALVAIHLSVSQYWHEILLALRCELGLHVSPHRRSRPAPNPVPRRHAAF